MCGIAGAVNWGNAAILARMTDVQRHRGPDDSGILEFTSPDGTWVGLGSRRLSILDLSAAGHMPMSTSDGRYSIVYNGEIYNYPELRKLLESHGYHFRSHCDTEAVLYLYQQYGPECVSQLNGMFAFAIWDRDREQLFIARDHLGIKPFYYAHRGDKFAFASEVKGLLELPDLEREMSYPALSQYLTFLWVPDPLTMFEGIYKLPPGHCGTFRRGKLELNQYWDLDLPQRGQQFAQSEAALTEELYERFLQVIKRQMLSDVPLGAFLSAGLDSSSIVAAMSEVSSSPVRTYTISVANRYRRGSNFSDDPAVARRTAAHFGCIHTEIEAEPDVAALLPRLVWHMDEPVADPAIITCYLVNREARKSVKVLLAGNGGDELFAGYRKYRADQLAERYQLIPRSLRRYLIEPVIDSMPTFRGNLLARYVHFAKKLARSGSLPAQDRFIQHSVYLTKEHQQRLCSSFLRGQIVGRDPHERHLAHFRQVEHADFLNQMLYVDTKTFLVGLNLNYNDKMSMANSVEVRVPFLDREFMQWAMTNIPPKFKLNGRHTKNILRNAVRSRLPAEVLKQPKAGFGAPVEFWLPDQLREMVDDLLGETNLRRRNLFAPEAVRTMVAEQRSGQGNWAYQIWQLLTLELWMQSYIDNRQAVPEKIA